MLLLYDKWWESWRLLEEDSGIFLRISGFSLSKYKWSVCVCLNWPRVHFGVPPGGSRCWGEVSVLCLYFHHMYMHQAHSFMTSKYLLTEWITECHRWPHAGFRELQSMLVMLSALIRNLFGWLWFLSFGVFGLSAKWKL